MKQRMLYNNQSPILICIQTHFEKRGKLKEIGYPFHLSEYINSTKLAQFLYNLDFGTEESITYVIIYESVNILPPRFIASCFQANYKWQCRELTENRVMFTPTKLIGIIILD